jgi:3-oxoacyl-[acyl-carrier protein] reductase
LPAQQYELCRFHKIGDIKTFQTAIDISLLSLIRILQAFIPDMMKSKNGKIILMLSAMLIDGSTKYISKYMVVKHALLGLMKSLAEEYADKGILINGVSPGLVDTKYLANVPEVVINENVRYMQNGKLLDVEDVVQAFLHLLLPSGDHVNGENIMVVNADDFQ